MDRLHSAIPKVFEMLASGAVDMRMTAPTSLLSLFHEYLSACRDDQDEG
jgi:hypothetical protein